MPDSLLLPESEKPPCARCAKSHGINDVEACHLARRLASRCTRCGLIHEDYDYTAMILDGLDKFDCEIYIPDVEKLQMDGETIIVPEHVQIKLDKIWQNKQDLKKEQDAEKE